MNTPPLLLAAAALFWAWQTGNWLVGAAAAALLEAPRYSARRWNLANAEFNRVSDFCAVLLTAIALYLYFTFGNPRAITLLFQWMPMILLPLALAQAWSTSREIDLSVLFYSLRKNPMRRASTINLGYPAFALLLVAASSANTRGGAFYAALALLVAWPLWLSRPRSYAAPVWALMLSGAVAAGFAGHVGLNKTQQWLEATVPEWMAGGGARTNPFRNTTDIGSIGELKQSDRIVLRVNVEDASQPGSSTAQGSSATAENSAPAPLLLHRASYDSYSGGGWLARNAHFDPVAPFGSAANWKLADADTPLLRVTVHDFSSDANPVLSLPTGTARIEGLAASDMKANALGAVQVEHRPGFFSYRVTTGAGMSVYGGPSPLDLKIPERETKVIAQIAAGLKLATLPQAQALAALKQFFDSRFAYSTWQKKPTEDRTSLAEFLLITRAGHCEYFASATVLLLRAAGIPARYATGFSAQEMSTLEGALLVRERHAHAWARAWIDGKWQDVDTTPAAWFAMESAQTPLWEPISDLWSWARFRLAQFSARAGERGWDAYLGWLALPLAFWLGWRTLRGRRAETALQSGALTAGAARPGQDSEFYLVVQRAALLGHARPDALALSDWLAGLAADAALEPDLLQQVARLHYRYRFDPAGLPAAERALLRERALAWVARHPVLPQGDTR